MPSPPATVEELDELLNVIADEYMPRMGSWPAYLRRRLAKHGVYLVPNPAEQPVGANFHRVRHSPYYTEEGV